jgi:ankyrin repeat protein
MGGDAEMVRLLLSRGADPDLPDLRGRGGRQLALDLERPELARLLD